MKIGLKKNRYWITGLSIVAVFTMGYTAVQIPEAKAEREQEEAQAEVTDQVEAIVKDVNALYSDESRTMLAEGVTLDEINAIEAEVLKLEGSTDFTNESGAMLNESITELSYAKAMVELRDMTNALFNTDGTVKEDVDVQAVQTKANEVKEFKPEYASTIQVQIDDANIQLAAIS